MASLRKKWILIPLAIAIPLIAYVGPSSYRKFQMDKEVDRLCAIDGGIKVFERISLSADKFDQFGNPNVPLSTSRGSETSAYVVVADVEALVTGASSGRGVPSLNRFISRVIRVSDRKILGEAIGYYRFGGDPEGPWHPSNYTGCTHEPGKNLNRVVFFKMP